MLCGDCKDLEKSRLAGFGYCRLAGTFEQKAYMLHSGQECWKGLSRPSEASAGGHQSAMEAK